MKTVEAGRPAQTRKVAANQAWFEYPAGARREAGRRRARTLRAAARRRRADRALRRARHRPGAQQSRGDRQPAHLSPRCASAATSISCSPTSARSRRECAMDTAEADPFDSKDYPVHRAGGSHRDLRRRARLRRRPAAGDDPLRHAGDLPNARKDSPPHSMLGVAQKKWFLAAAEELDRDLEDLGQLARHARLAHRSAEPAAGRRREPVARRRLRVVRRRRLERLRDRARRDLRLRARATHHRLRDRRRRPAFVLGRAAPRRRCRRGSSSRSASSSSPARSRRRRCRKALEHNMPKDHPLRSLFVHQTARRTRRTSAR